jgi:NADPH-dependent ferric siderophore reductase
MIEATVQGSRFAPPDPAPRRLWVVGDLAAVPAVNALLGALGPVPATVWLEQAHATDGEVPVRAAAGQDVVRVPRERDGLRLVETVRAALTADAVDPVRDYVWITCEAASTRALTRHVRRDLGMARSRLHGMAYWSA